MSVGFGGSVVPTKLELIRLRRRLAVSERVHKILEDKREVLLHQLDELVNKATQIRDAVWKDIQSAYSALNEAYLTLGAMTVDSIASTTSQMIDVSVKGSNMMGIFVPEIEVTKSTSNAPTYGFANTSVTLDQATITMRNLLPNICRAAQIENAIFRLAEELRKTQRQINALEYLIIPRYRRSISFIRSTLEEREREEFIRLKTVKRILERKKT